MAKINLGLNIYTVTLNFIFITHNLMHGNIIAIISTRGEGGLRPPSPLVRVAGATLTSSEEVVFSKFIQLLSAISKFRVSPPTHTLTHTCAHTHAHVHTHTRTHMHKHTYTHIHTQAH